MPQMFDLTMPVDFPRWHTVYGYFRSCKQRSIRSSLKGAGICILIGSTQTIFAIVSALAQAQDVPSYPPFNKACTDSEIGQHIQELSDLNQVEFADLALRICGFEAIPAITNLLQHPNSTIRDRAISILGEINPVTTNEISNPNETSEVSDEAELSVVTEQASSDAQVSVSDLIQLLKNPNADADARINAVNTLAFIGSDAKAAIPDLIEALGDESREVRRAAGLALIEIGSDAVPGLVAALKSSDAVTRVNATYALGKIGRYARAATPAMISALKDSDARVRSNAAFFLGERYLYRSNSNYKTVISALAETLRDSDENVRLNAGKSLGIINASSILISALNDRDADVVKAAAYGLMNYDPLSTTPYSTILRGEDAFLLRRVAGNPENRLDVRWMAAVALERHGYDMQTFFTENHLVSPQNAACPDLDFATFTFDIYRQRCIYVGGGPTSGGSPLFDTIRRIFGSR